jgi:hypothetical protein
MSDDGAISQSVTSAAASSRLTAGDCPDSTAAWLMEPVTT